MMIEETDRVMTEKAFTASDLKSGADGVNVREKLKIDSIFKEEGFSVVKQQEFKVSFDRRTYFDANAASNAEERSSSVYKQGALSTRRTELGEASPRLQQAKRNSINLKTYQ